MTLVLLLSACLVCAKLMYYVPFIKLFSVNIELLVVQVTTSNLQEVVNILNIVRWKYYVKSSSTFYMEL